MTATALCALLSSTLVISHIKLCLIIIVCGGVGSARRLSSVAGVLYGVARIPQTTRPPGPHQSDIVSQLILPLDEIETSYSHMDYVDDNLILHPMPMLNVE